MPRGLKRVDFYNEYLVFGDEKLTFILENVSKKQIVKKLELPYKEEDLQTLLEIASKSSRRPLQSIFDMTIPYAEIILPTNEKERVFVTNQIFWEIANGYLPKE